jgi:hypothetical protein
MSVVQKGAEEKVTRPRAQVVESKALPFFIPRGHKKGQRSFPWFSLRPQVSRGEYCSPHKGISEWSIQYRAEGATDESVQEPGEFAKGLCWTMPEGTMTSSMHRTEPATDTYRRSSPKKTAVCPMPHAPVLPDHNLEWRLESGNEMTSVGNYENCRLQPQRQYRSSNPLN